MTRKLTHVKTGGAYLQISGKYFSKQIMKYKSGSIKPHNPQPTRYIAHHFTMKAQ